MVIYKISRGFFFGFVIPERRLSKKRAHLHKKITSGVAMGDYRGYIPHDNEK